MHPLAGATLRIQRADKHLRELTRRIETFRKRHANSFVAEYDPETSNARIGFGKEILLPGIISVLVGEIVYNLRSALDYLIFELAILDSGQVIDGTQFPIEDTPEGFKRRQRYVRGLNRVHIAMVKALQPYTGVNWTRQLRDLSNPDKHRHLTITAGEATGVLRISVGKPGSFDGRDGTIFRAAAQDGSDVHVEGHVTVFVTLPDGPPIVDILEVLKAQVSETIDAFKPEFQ